MGDERAAGAAAGTSAERIRRATSAMSRASSAMTRDVVEALARRQQEHRLAIPMRLTDRLLEDLEQLNLAGRRRVPIEWEPRLARLAASIPGEVRDLPDLRTRVLPTRLMDSLFELQDRLLDLKVGPVRPLLQALDAELPEPAEPEAGEDRSAVA